MQVSLCGTVPVQALYMTRSHAATDSNGGGSIFLSVCIADLMHRLQDAT
jgi:hypothetical protein